MRIPNSEKAVIAREKIEVYLLNTNHRRGSAKARLLLAFGYQPENWTRLADDLRQYHLTADITVDRQTEYGHRYEIIAPVATPSGRSLTLHSVWQIDTGTDHPRLLTIYPG